MKIYRATTPQTGGKEEVCCYQNLCKKTKEKPIRRGRRVFLYMCGDCSEPPLKLSRESKNTKMMAQETMPPSSNTKHPPKCHSDITLQHRVRGEQHVKYMSGNNT